MTCGSCSRSQLLLIFGNTAAFVSFQGGQGRVQGNIRKCCGNSLGTLTPTLTPPAAQFVCGTLLGFAIFVFGEMRNIDTSVVSVCIGEPAAHETSTAPYLSPCRDKNTLQKLQEDRAVRKTLTVWLFRRLRGGGDDRHINGRLGLTFEEARRA